MTSIQLIQDYFGKIRKVEMPEFKALSKEERDWFADEIAKERGLTKNAEGKYV